MVARDTNNKRDECTETTQLPLHRTNRGGLTKEEVCTVLFAEDGCPEAIPFIEHGRKEAALFHSSERLVLWETTG